MRLVALLLAVSLLAVAQANFLAAEGFSGRTGFTCSACHVRSPIPTPDASIEVLGIPASYESGMSYPIQIRMLGGPQQIPGLPAGGFEIEASGGFFSNLLDDKIRHLRPNQATYTEAGAMVRNWEVEWRAPALDKEPAPVTIWVAGIAANGNHVVALNTTDLGEFGDAVASAIFQIQPSRNVTETWRNMPLTSPTLTMEGDRLWLRQSDGNATSLRVKFNGGNYNRYPRQEISFPLSEVHSIEATSLGANRTSATILYLVEGNEIINAPIQPKSTPLSIIPSMVALSLVVCLRKLR